MISAIVYNSLTGSCEKYAQLLSAALHVPALPSDKANIRSDGQVIFVGWLFAGSIKGYKQAAEKNNVAAVVSVGMSPVGEASADICREANSIPEGVAVFCRQGAFNINKLPLILRLIMKVKNKSIAANLQAKAQLNEQEQAVYTMATTGVGEPPQWNVDDIVQWAKQA